MKVALVDEADDEATVRMELDRQRSKTDTSFGALSTSKSSCRSTNPETASYQNDLGYRPYQPEKIPAEDQEDIADVVSSDRTPAPVLSNSALNTNLKKEILRELRKPGKNYGKLFDALKRVNGDLSTRRDFVAAVILHAKRYKKSSLVEQLENYMSTLQRSAQ